MSIDNVKPASEDNIVPLKIQTYHDESTPIKSQDELDDFYKFCINHRKESELDNIDEIKTILMLD